MLCGDASLLFLDDFCQHLSSVLGRTELCHEVRNPRPQTPQIIRNANLREEKGTQTQTFWSDIFQWVGVFHVNGWGPKSSRRPSKPGKSNFFGRDIPGFCRDIPGVPEKFEKKRFVFNSRALTPHHLALSGALRAEKYHVKMSRSKV